MNIKTIIKGAIIGSLLFTTLNASQRSSIKLGTEDWAPFSFEDKKTKEISGISTDIINEVFKLMNVTISSNKVMPWARTQEFGFQGRLDAVYTASINDERKTNMYFPKESIIESKWVLFAKKSNKAKLKFDDFKSLNGKKICLISGYNYPSDFKDYIYKHAKVTTVSKEALNISKLIHGRCDYMPAVLETTLEMAKTSRELKKIDAYNKMFYFEKPLSVSKFYLMFSKKKVSKEFVDKFSQSLIEFKTTQKYKDILKEYL